MSNNFGSAPADFVAFASRKAQFGRGGSSQAAIEEALEGPNMSTVTREEMHASLRATIAEVSAMSERMRTENERVRAAVESVASKVDASSVLAQQEMKAFREEMSRRSVETQFAVTREVHQMKAWILTGVLTGAIAVLGMFLKPYLDPGSKSVQQTPSAQTQPSPVIVQLSPEALSAIMQHRPAPATSTHAK